MRIYPYNFNFFLAGDINDPALLLEKKKKRQRYVYPHSVAYLICRDESPADPPILKIQKTEEMKDVVGENLVTGDAFANEQGIEIESSIFGETPWQADFAEENSMVFSDLFLDIYI